MKRIDGDEKLLTELKAAEKHRFGGGISRKWLQVFHWWSKDNLFGLLI